MKRGKEGAAEVRKVGKSAAKAGAKAGFRPLPRSSRSRSWIDCNGTKAIKAKKSARRKKIAAAKAGAAAVTAAGIAVARSQTKEVVRHHPNKEPGVGLPSIGAVIAGFVAMAAVAGGKLLGATLAVRDCLISSAMTRRGNRDGRLR